MKTANKDLMPYTPDLTTPPATAAARESSGQWWRGLTELGSVSLTQGALGIERIHLSIADETFNILAQIPATRPVSQQVRVVHHGISTLCYRSVAGAGRLLSRQLGKE